MDLSYPENYETVSLEAEESVQASFKPLSPSPLKRILQSLSAHNITQIQLASLFPLQNTNLKGRILLIDKLVM